MNSPTEDLGRHLARELESFEADRLPGAVLEATKRRILDTIGIVVAGGGLGQGSRTLAALVEEEGGRPESRLLGTGLKVPCRAAALVNAGFAHALDYDDVFSPVRVHPDAITVPTALAVAEKVGGVPGRELVAAVALADDLAIRVGQAIFRAPAEGPDPMSWPGRSWHPTLIAGYVSATAVAGRLLGLDAEQLVHAFGITLYRTAGTLAYVRGARNLVAELYYGFPSEVGVMSALMAGRGVTGPTEPFEGEGGLFPAFFGDRYHRESLSVGFGTEFEAGIETKPWPAVRTSHVYIQASLRLVQENGLAADQVQEIVIHCGRLAQLACEPLALRIKPRTAIDAKFSIPFIVAVAIANRSVRIRDFLPTNLADPAVLALAERVRLQPDAALDGDDRFRGAGLVAAVVEVTTRTGARHSARVEFARGGPADPMSLEEVADKFRDCCQYAARQIPGAQVDRIVELVSRLEDVPDVAELMELL